ncbi:MAG: NAD(P)-binding domain-containing protein [Myxococcota bacterium]
MRRTTAVIIGAGQAGLAMSYWLSRRSIDHVVLERGEVAQSWRSQRWDSLRLLTPNWQSRLPGLGTQLAKPDGFRSKLDTIQLLTGYAERIQAPVHSHTRVRSVLASGNGDYRVRTEGQEWHCRSVIVATGACSRPKVPAMADQLPAYVHSLSPLGYRNPNQLGEGGVLVVGASASGVQIARELRRSGRPVTLAVGGHVRMPRRYRGRDIQWWLETSGLLDVRYDEVDDVRRARRVPSAQLVAGDETLDLNHLQAEGVTLAGRLVDVKDSEVRFSGSLANVCALADLKMKRMLKAIDEWAEVAGFEAPAPERYPRTEVPKPVPLEIDLQRAGIETVIWATGYRPDFSYLQLPVFDRRGELIHDGGVLPVPGVYVLGLPLLRRRRSSLIDGAGEDARELSAHLASHLTDGTNRVA